MNKKEQWILDPNNKKYKHIRQSFHQALKEQVKGTKITYYDFLLVAKKLSFRFEESAHLMKLKNWFNKNKNLLPIKQLVESLSLNQESLNKDDKMQIIYLHSIVRFDNNDEFAPIKEVLGEEEDEYLSSDEEIKIPQKFQKLDSNQSFDHDVQNKINIILSIKMQEMEKKLTFLLSHHQPQIFNAFNSTQQITYQTFKDTILTIISNSKEKIKISEDDIKTLFHVFDHERNNYITIEDVRKLKDLKNIKQKLSEFYQSRINKDMVKNTLFKLGKTSDNNIQIFQVKNVSVLEFQQIQESILHDKGHKVHLKKKIPNFGPLKGTNKGKKIQKHNYSSDTKIKYQPKKAKLINKQRQKIQRILKVSKEQKIKDKKGQTVANKLRSLFIRKVILPREKMLEEEKEKYLKGKIKQNQLSIKPLKDTF